MRAIKTLTFSLLLFVGCGSPTAQKISHLPSDPAPTPRAGLHILDTVTPEAQFRVFRRRRDNNHWDDGSPYPITNALAILIAADVAERWDGKSHAAAYGMLHAYEPPLTISLAWCLNIKDKRQRDRQSIHLCYGNRLFWYGSAVYQLPEESGRVFDRVFPENK